MAFTPVSFDSYPWSHSLALALVWGLLVHAVLRGLLGRTARVSSLIGAVVVSHWFLNWVTHRPDLPLWPGGRMLGLGLWNSAGETLLIKGVLLAGGLILYQLVSTVVDALGQIGLISLVSLVVTVWLAGPFSPLPPSETAVALVTLALWIIPLWAWMIETHRRPSPSVAGAGGRQR